jgi:bacteriorhodopsin
VHGHLPGLLMPSLFRFLIFLGLLVGLGYGAVFSLATFVKYQPREIIVTIPPDKFLKNH